MNRYSKLNLFSTEGRIGRFIFFLFSFIMPASVFWLIAAITGQLYQKGVISTTMAYGLLAVAIIIAIITLMILTIQRSHDLNRSGWLSLIVLLFPPLISVFWLIPGSKGVNNYHAPVPPLSTGLKLVSFLLFLALLLPMIYLIKQYSLMTLFSKGFQQLLSILP